MKIARFRWLIALMTLLALTAAACSSGDGDADVEASADDASAAVDEVEASADDAMDEAEDAASSGDLGLLSEGQLLVGSDIAFEPFESIVDGEPVGFDIDLMNEVASRIGVEVEYQNTPFDTIFTQLAGGSFDAIISAITITDERDETIDFSDPYFAANQGLATLEDSEITSVADLSADTTIGVQAATTGAEYALENFGDSSIQEFPTSVDAFAALTSDSVDAVFIDLPVVGGQVEAGTAILAEEVNTDELYGVGVAEGNTGLATAINDALTGIIEDGTYAEIYGEWFEGDVPEVFAS